MSDDEQRAEQRRGVLGILLMVVPVASIVVVGIAYAVAFWYGIQGRDATGPRVRMDFSGCPEALPLVEQRLAAMGLPEVATEGHADGFAVTVRLPDDPRQVERIPATLAREGRFVVRAGDDGEVLLTRDDVTDATVEMAFLDVPHARIGLEAEAARRLSEHMQADIQGSITAWIDGEQVWSRTNLPAISDAEIDLDPVHASSRVRLDFAAETAIILEHGPLPCEVDVAGVSVLDGDAP